MEELTVAHVSDTHLGKRQYKSELRRKDFTKAFREVVEKIIEREDDIDVLIHSGDLFDSPNPSVEAISDCIEIFSMLEDTDIDVLGIVGNHERKRGQQWMDIVNKFENVERLGKEPVEYDGVNIYGIDAIRKHSWDSTDISLEGDDDKFNIVCMHELVSPPVPGHMADYELENVLDRLGIDVDILALGDYHEDETETVSGTKAIYPGSTEKTKRSESENHSFNLYRIKNGKHKLEKITLDEPRKFLNLEREVRGNVSDFKKWIDSYDEQMKNNPVVVIQLKGEENGMNQSEIEDYVKKMGASIVKVIDERGISEIDGEDVEDIDNTMIEEEMDSFISEMEISTETKEIENIIRDEEIPNNRIRDEVRETIKGDKNED